MSHEQGDNIAGWGVGGATALLAHLTDLAQSATLAGEALHTLVFGIIGGAAGYLGKRAIETLIAKLKRKKQER